MNKQIVTVTGAAGQIGYALLFRIASGAVFGPDVAVELRLLELEGSLPALEGVAMELNDCAFPTLEKIVCTADMNEAMLGTQWALLVGAAPRKAGMERSDLLGINGKIFTGQGKAINNHAADDVRVVVVGNPCNTNCFIAMNHAPDVPNDRFFAMTMLDERRARAQLAEKAAIAVRDVRHMAIWGNHSATQYPDFYNAYINEQPVLDVIDDEAWLQQVFIPTVQQRGAAVIKARGASSAASAANGAIETVRHLFEQNTSEGECFSVGLCSQGQYGITPGLIYSYPCKNVNGELQIIEGISHNAFAVEKLKESESELLSEKEIVTELGLV